MTGELQDRVDALRASYLAEGLSEDELGAIAAIAEPLDAEAGVSVVKLGESSDDLFVLVSGRLTILGPDQDFVGHIRPGGVLGEIGLLDERPRSASAVADEPSRLLRIPAYELRALMHAQTGLAMRLLTNLGRLLCSRLRAANLELAVLQVTVEK